MKKKYIFLCVVVVLLIIIFIAVKLRNPASDNNIETESIGGSSNINEFIIEDDTSSVLTQP